MVYTITKDFGFVPCGIRAVATVELENNTKKAQALKINWENKELTIFSGKIQIHPSEIVAQPKQTVRFKLNYTCNVEDVVENFYYNILDGETLVAHLKIRAHSVGPTLEPTIFNVKFFRLHDVNQTVKHVEIENKTKYEASYFFDLDEDYEHLKISRRCGVLPAGLKLGLTLTFNAKEPGVYYKKIFCIIQFHKPIIFSVLAVNKPKVKLNPKNIILKYPTELNFSSSYEALMYREDIEKIPDGDKIPPLQKCLEDLELSDITNAEDTDNERQCWTLVPEGSIKSECNSQPGNIFLTTNFVDIGNSSETVKATSLINMSKSEYYYYEWDHDPNDIFQIAPCKGFINPNTKTDFTIYFTPSANDCLYHMESDIKIFVYSEESEVNSPNIIDLPLMISLKIIGHSFPNNSCGWVPQCKIIPKVLFLRSSVPNEIVYGCFKMERSGHLPFSFAVIPTKEQHFTVHPPLGFVSQNFRLLVVEFNNNHKEPGVYVEDLKIKLNNSDLNIETIKVIAVVEIPRLVIGKNNSITFDPIFPGSKISIKVQIENPTSLFLSYEFKTPDDITWVQVVNPKGFVEPKDFSEVEVIFQPEAACEYLDYIPCFVSSVTKTDYFETIQLQVIGSCQYGYLIATPSIYDFGQCIYLTKISINIHLFNFSQVLLYFRLTVIDHSYPPGDTTDVTANPAGGRVPAKGSLTLDVTITPHKLGTFEYVIECQNFKDDSDEAEPCDPPKRIILLKFEGVLPYIQIIDVNLYNGGPLFSSHWLWKMLRIDRMNAALKSLKPREIIVVKIPEAVRYSGSAVIVLMVESSKYGKIYWRIEMEIQCPCYQASSGNITSDCMHSKPVNFERPTTHELNAMEKLLLLIRINYDFTNECMMVMTIRLPHKRQLVLKMPLVTLPTEGPTCISSYLNSSFILRPVFIGDPQPPLQLFWLYNNTSEPSSYSVNMDALRKHDVHNVFDCINPKGVIQPFSPYPLAFIFRPTEMIQYSVDVPVNLQREYSPVLNITGEGILQLEPIKLIAIPKTVPEVPLIHKEDLECCKNLVNIPFISVFSAVKRIFYLRNTSPFHKWAFRWSPFKFENIFAVRVEPESGMVEPGEKALMTLFFHTFCYPTFVSFSVPCTIYDYSELMEYNIRLRMQEMAEEESKDYFTITEKGISYGEANVKPIDKPKEYYIFITVNANIISHFIVNNILSQKLKCTMKAENEIKRTIDFDITLKPPMRHYIEGLLEKLLWEILCSRHVVDKIKNSQQSQDLIYQQILPGSHKKTQEFVRLLTVSPHKRFLQTILENTIREAVLKNFTPAKPEK